MNHKYVIIISSFAILFLFGCSTSLPEIKTADKKRDSIYENNLRINLKKIYSWVNKMPGPDAKPRFQITGELELLDDTHYNLNYITIKKLKIIQNNIVIYQFTPVIEIKFDGKKKNIIFSTVKGLLLSSQLKIEENINVEIIFSDSDKEINYLIPNVKVNEVF